MTTPDWISVVWCALAVVSAGHLVVASYLHAEVARTLDEVRRCNDDFAQATELLQKGRHDEGVVVLRKWRERA
jgi:hypothetical protein